MRRLLAFVWLTVLWLILWRDISVANIASGAIIAALVATGVPVPGTHRVRPIALIRLVGNFLWRLVEANLVLAREVVTPTNHLNTGIVAVRLPGYSDLQVTMIGNATSLTPGTLTLEVGHRPEPVLYVHVLHLRTEEEARADVHDLAERFAHAFPYTPDPDIDAAREETA